MYYYKRFYSASCLDPQKISRFSKETISSNIFIKAIFVSYEGLKRRYQAFAFNSQIAKFVQIDAPEAHKMEI